jgi:hypothetical protein
VKDAKNGIRTLADYFVWLKDRRQVSRDGKLVYHPKIFWVESVTPQNVTQRNVAGQNL